MEETFEMAVACITRLLSEDRYPTEEERALLSKMVAVLLADIHSISASLKHMAYWGRP